MKIAVESAPPLAYVVLGEDGLFHPDAGHQFPTRYETRVDDSPELSDTYVVMGSDGLFHPDVPQVLNPPVEARFDGTDDLVETDQPPPAEPSNDLSSNDEPTSSPSAPPQQLEKELASPSNVLDVRTVLARDDVIAGANILVVPTTPPSPNNTTASEASEKPGTTPVAEVSEQEAPRERPKPRVLSALAISALDTLQKGGSIFGSNPRRELMVVRLGEQPNAGSRLAGSIVLHDLIEAGFIEDRLAPHSPVILTEAGARFIAEATDIE